MKRKVTVLVVVLLCLATVACAAPPRKLVLMPQEGSQLLVGETFALSAHPLPVDASPDVVWNSSNKKIATVDENGLVTAVGAGTVKIRARAVGRPSVFAVRTFSVAHDPAQARLSIEQAPLMMCEGEQVVLDARVEPADAKFAVTWTSSNPRVAEVDSGGRVWARGTGSATIYASIDGGPEDSVTVNVRTLPRALTVPKRTTDVHGIAENLERIDDVRLSALIEVNRLAASGAIPAADARRRVEIIDRAFAMYSMPWMTEKIQPYWTRAYGTKKDFVPGVVYYGMPYIQHGLRNNSINRTYDLIKALTQGYYRKTGNGYYLLSPTLRRDGMYVGSDCSSFIGMSIFGKGRNAFMRTRQITNSNLYRTLASYAQLRPGDIIVRGGKHVVFFLYYTDAAETQMMIIEQGGGDLALDIHNTVCCSIVPVSKYVGEGYRPRRLATLAKS